MFDVVEAIARQNLPPDVTTATGGRQFPFHPLFPLAIEMLVNVCALVFLERGINPGFHRIESQETPGKTVNRADMRTFHVTHRLVTQFHQLGVGDLISVLKRANRLDFVPLGTAVAVGTGGNFVHELQPAAQPYLHLTSGLLGKGQRDHVRQRQPMVPPGQ